jgi:exodeoxyribonuclease V gamma subunit
MECLAESLIDCIQATVERGCSVFESDVILVQSPGMSQWLKIQIAEKLGISANIDFPLPSSFIWQLYQQHLADLPEQSAFTKANMQWKLMSILPGLLDLPAFLPIKQYLADQQPIKYYQLAAKIADVYDQYLVYRPDWILSWEQGNDQLAEIDTPEHNWQPILWRALVDYTQAIHESPAHRANLHQDLLLAIAQSAQQPDSVALKPIMVFGISAMPLQQLQVLNALAETRDVVIFWFNPSQHYWGDIVDTKTLAKAQLKSTQSQKKSALSATDLLDVGNPLLASWGKLGRDYQDMLLSFDVQQQDCFMPIETNSLLQHIQGDVNNLQFRGTQQTLDPQELLSNGSLYPKIEVDPADSTLQVHACHSKVRELEILHDQLLKRFNDNPSWHPGDVIVMMPDVAAYAPFIEGVFGSVSSDLAIPYAISDRNLGQMSPLLASFLQLMNLQHSRLGLSEILSLIEVPAIQNKFAISAQEYDLLQHWLIDAGVRWGWDEDDKERWQLPAQSQNTWLFGLQRLLAGYAMNGQQLYQGREQIIAPYGDIEGQQAIALGKCYQFTQVLLQILAFCQTPAPIEKKVTQALTWIEKLYAVSDTEQSELQILRATLDTILTHSSQYSGPIEQDIFVGELQQNIQQTGVGQRFLAGYINFCTLMPMRSIPFKMVCLLGMNDNDYPRQSVPMGFDLMRLAPSKRGDRSRRLDDRYLFLEALLSATQQLYFSYQGFSQKDNGPLAPSILLSELLEYCQQGFCLTGQLVLAPQSTEENLLKHLVISHQLQPFNPSYFNGVEQGDSQNTLFSFQQKHQKIAEQRLKPTQTDVFNAQVLPRLQDAPQQQQNLEIVDLIRFYENPAKAFFVNRWQSRFAFLRDQSADEEPFVFDGLDKYQINDRLIQHYMSEAALKTGSNEQATDKPGIQKILRQLRAEGKLPIGLSGEISLQKMAKASATLATQIIELTQAEHGLVAQSHWVDIDCGSLRITGRISHLFGQRLLLWRPGKLRAKDRISLYLHWLILCACPPKSPLQQAYFLSTNNAFILPLVAQDQALQALQLWSEYWLQGQNQSLHFYPETAWTWVNSQDRAKSLAVFHGSDYKVAGVNPEGSEEHINRVCADLSVFFDDFSGVSEDLLRPLVDLLEQQ